MNTLYNYCFHLHITSVIIKSIISSLNTQIFIDGFYKDIVLSINTKLVSYLLCFITPFDGTPIVRTCMLGIVRTNTVSASELEVRTIIHGQTRKRLINPDIKDPEFNFQTLFIWYMAF